MSLNENWLDLASRSVCKWRVQPCDSDLKERFLSFVCLSIYLFVYFAIRISRFFPSYFFCYPHFFPSAFSHPHRPSAGIRSAFYRHPFRSPQSISKVNIWRISMWYTENILVIFYIWSYMFMFLPFYWFM